jgi:hypothetical protein
VTTLTTNREQSYCIRLRSCYSGRVNKQANPVALRRIVRAAIADGCRIDVSDAIEDLLVIGIDSASLVHALESLDDIAESNSIRKLARQAAENMREQMRNAISGNSSETF